ncbi:phage antirepressor KilAC domain-containing protein [Pyxidicoccus trucidator]|uniref:phage antirepressor KilAC domain-containing protein n=1 Tax=Pyxidicoccus trucidator TaxID=2709662 RepID=UPI0013DB10F9|nr:phage antirepressor KilAC domain-containing protein [Pyxidicoccus trucidator]
MRYIAQQPAVEFVDRYASAESCLSLRDSAKRLRIPPMTLNRSLVEDRVLFRNPRKVLEPYADFIQRGLFVFPPHLVPVKKPEGEVMKDFSQTRVTTAGVVWLGERYAHLSAPLPH